MVWSRDGNVVSIAADSASEELATRGVDGTVTIWNSISWQGVTLSYPKSTGDSQSTVRDCSQTDGFIKYGHFKNPKLPKTLLMVTLLAYNKYDPYNCFDSLLGFM